MRDRYVYPAILDHADDGISVEFPDFPGCVTAADSDEEALAMAKEALGLRIYTMERDNEPLPNPTTAATLRTEPGQLAALIEVWMPPFRDSMQERSVKKTLTLPKWLNDLAEAEQVNFSLLLQRRLKEYLGVCESPGNYNLHRPREVTLRRASEVHEQSAQWLIKRKAKAQDTGKPIE